ncbi:uncharacterized protein F4807DRAFT_435103 [Annulohypoxylon truncatum]|uniref:uncharacterized protein n=1 Tax=Annulohypoxylon truncatum TaxID=327061 RepID=UPI00200851BB|nr:uncharacterized protein F4807DRAFT_435103 [Annulohypoxylon truncatum]KAI1207273.1 hypothetical protein F4807DRAFT_435103 [Annulohypoxylon truncatum]
MVGKKRGITTDGPLPRRRRQRRTLRGGYEEVDEDEDIRDSGNKGPPAGDVNDKHTPLNDGNDNTDSPIGSGGDDGDIPMDGGGGSGPSGGGGPGPSGGSGNIDPPSSDTESDDDVQSESDADVAIPSIEDWNADGSYVSSSEEEDEAIINLDAVRYGDTEETVGRTVHSALKPLDVAGAATYEEILDDDFPPIVAQFDEDEEEEIESCITVGHSETTSESSNTIPSSTPHTTTPSTNPNSGSGGGKAPDTSRLMEMHQNKYIETSMFEKALAIYASVNGVSRKQWAALREVLHIIRDDNGNPIRDIINLPKQLSTLTERLRKRLPLMNMREVDIPLKVEKMPTETRTRRAKAMEKSKLRAQGKAPEPAKAGNNDKGADDEETHTITTKLTFFDPPTLIKNYISSDIAKDIHFGPAILVDYPTELYQSHCWSGSVRTSGGIYPHLKHSDVAIFPNDWVYYRCVEPNCFCHEIEDYTPESLDLHIGRVYGFGWDRRTESCTNKSDKVLALQIQEALKYENNDHRVRDVVLTPPHDENELILLSTVTCIPETSVYSIVDVFCDYQFGETLDNPNPPPTRTDGKRLPKKDIPLPKYQNPQFAKQEPEHEYYYARRMIRFERETAGDIAPTKKTAVPLCHTHPIRADLEIKHYGRDMFEFEWDQRRPNAKPIISLPFLAFIDGFGVFSNSYRSLMGFYITPAGLVEEDRSRPGNILPVVIGPHGSDFGDVVKALGTLADLDRGVTMNINGVDTLVCAFALCYIGDMPQQSENSGFKGPRAHKFCRGCYITSGKSKKSNSTRPDNVLDFDIIKHGRFHHQVKQMQRTMANEHVDAATKDTYGTQWGMSDPSPSLEFISPTLDLVLSRPFDPAHSEYNGLCNLMHFLLRDGILKPTAVHDYTLAFRMWPSPPGSRRLQSPKHHLASYNMSAHAIWSIMVPAFLRDWLKPSHIKQSFFKAASNFGDPVDLIIATCVAIAKSNTVLVGSKASKSDRDNMTHVVKKARELFTQLCICVWASAGSRANSLASTRGTPAVNKVADIVDQFENRPGEADKGRSNQYVNDTSRPNIHIAVHYDALAEEYGVTVNCNTLIGEDLHRFFKIHVYETNYSNIEFVLLMKINTRLSLRFVLRNAFRDDDPGLTNEIQELYQKCPTLFKSSLSHTDRTELEDTLESVDIELDVTTSVDDSHIDTCIINRIPTKEVRRITHPIYDNKPLPTRAANLPVPFTANLRLAYSRDYGYPAHHPTAWDPNAKVQWARKLGFTDRATKDRLVFSQGDYINYGSRHKFGRLDHIFLFDVYGERHIFAVVTPLRRDGTRDALLDLEILQESNDDPIIIGVPQIQPTRPYLVPIDGLGIILVDWSIKWL